MQTIERKNYAFSAIFVLFALALRLGNGQAAAWHSISMQSSPHKTSGLFPKVVSHASSSCRQLMKPITIEQESDDDDTVVLSRRRRTVLALLRTAALAATAVCYNVRPANAVHSGELFRPNPLVNPVLEKIRIWEQAEADNVKYGGELERGDAAKGGVEEGYFPRLLIPILGIEHNLGRVEKFLLESNQKQSWKESRQILSQSMFQAVEFKSIFNAYGDNIYYTNPDRANLYLGGGATPRPEQSVAYLLRNEILTKVQDLQAELDYLLKEEASTRGIDPGDTQEVILLANQAHAAMLKYLDLVPSEEVEQARAGLLKASSS
jgi:hypothetical protein